MSKFNERAESTKATTNHVGAAALKQSPELELVSLLFTSFAEDKYYETANEGFARLKNLLEKNDPLFAAKAIVYARTEFAMRSITHAAAAIMARMLGGVKWAPLFFEAVIRRPDDMMEIVSYYQANCADTSAKSKKRGKKDITNAMKVGFAKAFDKFDAYQLAKWRGGNKKIKLVDVVNISHPVPTDKNREALDGLIKGSLKSTDTWEAMLSKAGEDGATEDEAATGKKEAWAQLIRTKKIGYMALLRNLRNIIQQAPEVVDEACALLQDKDRIKNSLVLPFRFLTAYGEIEKLVVEKVFEKDSNKVPTVLDAIEKAIMVSIDNIPTLTGRTVILSDNSGSMRGDGGGHSKVSRFSNTKSSDIANLFAMMYWMKADNTLVGLFGDTLVHPKLDRSKGLFDNFKIVEQAALSCGANTEGGIFDMFRRMIKEKIIADTVVIFSDTQIGDRNAWYGKHTTERAGSFMALFSEYKKINPSFRCYSVDLKGYGTTVFDGSVIKIAGWSEKIFEIMKGVELDKDALINKIKSVAFAQ